MGNVRGLQKWIGEMGIFEKIMFTYMPLLIAVEIVWTNLWVSLWNVCGKVFGELWESWFSTKIVAKVGVFHDMVEKFCKRIYTYFDRGMEGFYTVSTAPTITTIKNII